MNSNTSSNRRNLYFYSVLFSNSNTDHSKDAESDIDKKIDDTAGTLSLKMSTKAKLGKIAEMYEPSIYSDVDSKGVSIKCPENERYSRNKISSSLEEDNVGNKVQWDKTTNPIRDSVQG